jgi:hypothetical protein
MSFRHYFFNFVLTIVTTLAVISVVPEGFDVRDIWNEYVPRIENSQPESLDGEDSTEVEEVDLSGMNQDPTAPPPPPPAQPPTLTLPAGYSYLKVYDENPVFVDACLPVVFTLDPNAVPAGGERIVNKAMAEVASMTQLPIQPAFTTSSPGMTISASFVAQADDPDLDGNVVGYAWSRSTRVGGVEHITSGEIVLDRDWFVDESKKQPDVAVQLIAHEIGHTLGLGHTNDKKSIMYPVIGAKHPSENDKQAFRTLNRGC